MRRIAQFSLGLNERRDPFEEHLDITGQDYMFVYLTGRGEYSYLFPPGDVTEVVGEAEKTIPNHRGARAVFWVGGQALCASKCSDVHFE